MENKINIMRALADETRLRIINLFIKSGQILCVCELVDALKIPQYAVSKALTIIKNADLLTAEKKGTWVYYGLNKTPQNKTLFTFFKSYLNEEILFEDEQRLNNRLLLREGNKCVVGIVPESDLLKMIKQKAEV